MADEGFYLWHAGIRRPDLHVQWYLRYTTVLDQKVALALLSALGMDKVSTYQLETTCQRPICS